MHPRRLLRDREHVLLMLIVVAVVVFGAMYLLPEVVVRVPSNNDDAFHFLFIQRASQALADGENPLDFWTPQLELGFATFVHYQNLPHLAVVALDRLLLGTVDLFTVFNVVRFLLLVSFPLTVLWSFRRMGASWPASTFAAAAAPLLATPFLYGFDYASYTWRGFGMYTQLWAMHLSFISIAATHTVIVRGRGHLLAIVSLTVLVLAHLLYAYFVAITIGVLFLVNLRRTAWVRQVRDLAICGSFALAITAYMWVPFIQLAPFMNVSPYLQPEKYDGFGAPRVLALLFTGELFDAGRLPILTILVGVGAVATVVRRRRLELSVLALFAVWVVLYFGRPTFGSLYDVLPLSQVLLIHRFSGPVHLAGILLIGIGAGWLWELVMRVRGPWIPFAAAAVAAIALVPAMRERAAFYEQGSVWMQQTRDAIVQDGDARAVVAAIRGLPRGRVFSGLRTDFGPRLNFGITFNSARMSDLLVFEGIDVVSPPYSSASLSSDMLWDFRYTRAEDYDLFDVRYAIVPAGLPVPTFLRPILRTGRYTLYEAPTSGYGEYVSVGERRAARAPGDLISQDRAWLLAADRTSRGHIQWDYPAATPGGPAVASACARGSTRDERVEAARVDVVASCGAPGTLLLKVTYDPGWRVTVDDVAVDTFMLSPAYVGVSVPAGTHTISARYVGVPSRMPLLGAGMVALCAAVVASRRLGVVA